MTTTTGRRIPEWLNIDAIVEPHLRVRADSAAMQFEALITEVLPLCREAVALKAQLECVRPEAEIEDVMRDAHAADRDAAADAMWKIFHELNGFARLDRAILGLRDLFDVVDEARSLEDFDRALGREAEVVDVTV